MDDQRIALPPILLAIAILALLWSRTACAAPVGGLVPGDYCDPDDGQRSFTREEKARTRERVRSACKARGGSDTYCAWHDAAVVRESWGGVASAVHRLGTDGDGDPEYGLGTHGLSVKWHRDKWPGDDEEPAFCTPEVSYLVADAIARRAVRVYGASNAVELQAVFGGGAGSRQCVKRGAPTWWRSVPVLSWLAWLAPPTLECFVMPSQRHVDAVCTRMGEMACRRPIGLADMGDDDLVEWDGARAMYIVTEAGRAWALERARSS